MAKQDFTAGQILTAAEMDTLNAAAGWNMDRSTQTGTTYTLVAADVGEYVTLNNAAAITLTVPDAVQHNPRWRPWTEHTRKDSL